LVGARASASGGGAARFGAKAVEPSTLRLRPIEIGDLIPTDAHLRLYGPPIAAPAGTREANGLTHCPVLLVVHFGATHLNGHPGAGRRSA